MKINYGCGEAKLPGFINIDIEESIKPDVICDLRKDNFPFDNESVETIYCLHNLEHIERQFWAHVFTEFRRVLVQDGILVLMYPEFEVCSRYFLENYRGQRDFWRNCLYGRQLWPGDYHVVPMVSSEVANHLGHCGFKDIKWLPEDENDQYTIMKAVKGIQITKETLLKKEIFHQ